MAAPAPSLEALRQAAQRAFLDSGQDLRVGDPAQSPWTLDELAGMDEGSPAVVQTIDGGLTARVHRLRGGGRDWTLKRARPQARVRNVDGQTSFLNELQRRADFLHLKAAGAPGLQAIVDTVCGSLQHGVLLSPWIDGAPVQQWDERTLRQSLQALTACHAQGLFEWDPSPGNLLDDGRQLWLFDFGYCYRFDPLQGFNSAGNGVEHPQFHPVERFESRTLFARLLKTEQEQGAAATLALLRLEKSIAIELYAQLHADLAARGASPAVLHWLQGLVSRWRQALAGSLEGLYLADGWRSHLHDLHDDLSGHSCTPMTLARADWLIERLQRDHATLHSLGALQGADRSRDGWIDHLQALRRRAGHLQTP